MWYTAPGLGFDTVNQSPATYFTSREDGRTFKAAPPVAYWPMATGTAGSKDSDVRRSMGRTTFAMVMLGIAAMVALLFGAIGIYGVISYTVSLRTRELGLRMALGAQQSDVSWLVLRKGLMLVAAGVAIGLAASAALRRAASINPLDALRWE